MIEVNSRNRRILIKLFRDEKGANLVEVAIAFLITLTLMFSILQFSLLLYMHHFLALAAEEGTRYAIVRGASWNSPCSATRTSDCVANAQNIADFVKKLSPITSVSNSMNVTVTWPNTDASGSTNPGSSGCAPLIGSNSPGCTVRVDVSYRGSILRIPLALVPTLTLSNSSILTIVQ